MLPNAIVSHREKTVTVGQYARAVGVHATTVYRWIEKGVTLPHPAIEVDAAEGRHTRIKVDAASFDAAIREAVG